MRSADSGRTWTPVISGNSYRRPCRSIAVDPWNAERIYAGIDGLGVLRSSDGGLTWSVATADALSGRKEASAVIDLEIHLQKPDILTALIEDVGLLRSTDAGVTWQVITGKFGAGGTEITGAIMHRGRPDVICVGTGTGEVYRTTNAGAAWVLSRRGNGYSAVRSFANDPSDNEKLYAGTEAGLEQSTDFGVTWSGVKGSLPRIPSTVLTGSDTSGTILYVMADATGLIQSADGGASWQSVAGEIGGASVRSIAVSRTGHLITASVGSGVCRTAAGSARWVSGSDGLPGTEIRSIYAAGNADSMVYAGTESGPFMSGDSGASWTPAEDRRGAEDMYFLAAHPFIPNRLIAATGKGLLASTNHGRSWSVADGTVKGSQLASLAFSPANAGIVLAAASDQLARVSPDGGLSWKRLSHGITATSISAVSFGSDPQTYFAWSSEGQGFRSTDGGLAWSQIPVSWTTTDPVLYAFDPSSPSSGVAIVQRSRVYLTSDGGATWDENGDAPLPANVLTIHWNNMSKTLFAGTSDAGVFRLVLARLKAPAKRITAS